MNLQPPQSAYGLTNNAGIKVLVYGRAGVGKTVLGATAPAPIFLSAENGLLSLRKFIEDRRASTGQMNFDIPVYTVNSVADLDRYYQFFKMGSPQAKQFKTIVVDSISEIGEQIVANAKRKTRDPRQAYGQLYDDVMDKFRDFRDLPGYNVYFIAKEEIVKAGVTGAVRYCPSFPGQALLPHTPYMFDETFNLNIFKDQEGKDFRALRTQPDWEYEAKDRSGRLDPFEFPDLTYIFNKIMGQV